MFLSNYRGFCPGVASEPAQGPEGNREKPYQKEAIGHEQRMKAPATGFVRPGYILMDVHPQRSRLNLPSVARRSARNSALLLLHCL